MQFITTIMFAVTTRLASLVIANPIPNCQSGGIAIPLARHPSILDSNKTVDLEEITSHGISVREKILIGLENYEINTGKMHPFAVKRSDSESTLGRRGTGAPLTDYRNKLWMAEISIGTPPKTLKVHVDTGSADTWVLQTGCHGISANRDLWDPDSSGSANTQTLPFRIGYTDGSNVQGDQWADYVTIGGFTADHRIFGSARSYTTFNKFEYPADGLLGLAFPSISRLGTNPLFTSLVQQHLVTDPRFSFKFSSSGAEMYVGGVNSMLYSGDITYTPITHPGFWMVSMDDVRVNHNQIFENIPAIFDTGSDHVVGDWERVAELYSRVGGTVLERGGFGLYYLRCDSFPTVSLTFGGRAFEIAPEALRLPPIKRNPTYCFSALMAQRSVGYWHIGLPLLQGVYSVFDYGNLQVGLADLA